MQYVKKILDIFTGIRLRDSAPDQWRFNGVSVPVSSGHLVRCQYPFYWRDTGAAIAAATIRLNWASLDVRRRSSRHAISVAYLMTQMSAQDRIFGNAQSVRQEPIDVGQGPSKCRPRTEYLDMRQAKRRSRTDRCELRTDKNVGRGPIDVGHGPMKCRPRTEYPCMKRSKRPPRTERCPPRTVHVKVRWRKCARRTKRVSAGIGQ